jgi:hypothetical protein
MRLREYFENAEGLGVMATADSSGNVDAAIYSRPHVIDEETVAFIMAERKTHENLQSNPHAAYLFKENGKGYFGTRLFLTKIREEKNSEKIPSMVRRKDHLIEKELGDSARYLVYFRVDRIVPLVGSGKCPITQ